MLKRGSVNCPKHKVPLSWEQFCGMRVYKMVDGVSVFKARCPKCKSDILVKT